MENLVGNITYIEPVSKFKKVNKTLMEKYDPLTVGIYCKIIVMSSKCNLNIKFIASALGVSKAKARSTIVFLESEGYIKRVPVKDENGHMKGWQYFVYPEQLPEDERSNAGKKKDDSVSRVVCSPCCRISDKSENDKDIYKETINNNKEKKDNNKLLSKKSSEKEGSLFVEEPTEEDKFNAWFKLKYPVLSENQRPLTLKGMHELETEFTDEEILHKLDVMEARKRFNRDYSDVQRTCANWLRMDKDPKYRERFRNKKKEEPKTVQL